MLALFSVKLEKMRGFFFCLFTMNCHSTTLGHLSFRDHLDVPEVEF